MTIDLLSSGSASSRSESFTYLVDYDDAAQTIGLTLGPGPSPGPAGTGHAFLVVQSNQQQPSTSISNASSGVDVASFTGNGVLNVQSVAGLNPMGGQVTAATSNGTAALNYAAISKGQLTGVALASGSGTLTHNGAVTAQQFYLGGAWCDQYGSSAGPLAAAGALDNVGRPISGSSPNAVTFDGTRKIVLGPGATGVDVNGNALSTAAVSAAVVGQFNVPGKQIPGLDIELSWRPNSFDSVAH